MNLKTMNFIIEEELLKIEPDLYRFAQKLVNNNAEDASDLLQESILKILTNVELYSNDCNFKAWCYTVMRNTFLNSIRKKGIEMKYIEKYDFAWDYIALQELIPNECDSVSLYKDTNDVLEMLPVDYSLPLKMFINGYRYIEIADKLNLPLSTIKNRIHIARLRMRIMLRDYVD